MQGGGTAAMVVMRRAVTTALARAPVLVAGGVRCRMVGGMCVHDGVLRTRRRPVPGGLRGRRGMHMQACRALQQQAQTEHHMKHKARHDRSLGGGRAHGQAAAAPSGP